MTSQIQRPLRGSRISSFYPVKTLPALSSLDSAFQLQEYISLLIRLDVHDVNTIVSLPVKTPEEKEVKEEAKKAEETKEEGKEKEKEKEGEKADKEEGKEVNVDEACWIYEQLRRLAQDLTHPLITTLQQECTRASCPEMKAGEWLYLCVAHGNDGAMEQCCAIDYILHTLDSATALLNSPRAFPSRLQIPQTSHRHFSALARRLGRIFAHAYFHHREAFEQAEAESSLYARFLALTAKFHLVPAEFLVIPPSAVGFDLGEHREDEREIQKEPPAPLVGREQEHERERKKSKSPPSLGLGPAPISPGDISPRRVGRNRTDTMVHSDARDLVEDLANRFGNSDAEAEEPEELDVDVKTARPGGYFVDGEEEEEELEGEIPPTPIAERVTGGIPHAELGLVEPEASIVAAVVKEVEREKEVEEKIRKGQEAAKEEESPALTPVVEVPTLEEEKEPAAAPAPAAEAAPAPVEEQSTPEETPAEEEEHEKTFAEVVKEAVSEPLAVPEEPKVEASEPEEEVAELKDEVTEEAPAPAIEAESTPVPVEAEEDKSEDVSVPEEVSAPTPEEAKDENETSVPEEEAVEEATSEKKDEVVPTAAAEHKEPKKEEAKDEEKAEKVEGGETAPASA